MEEKKEKKEKITKTTKKPMAKKPIKKTPVKAVKKTVTKAPAKAPVAKKVTSKAKSLGTKIAVILTGGKQYKVKSGETITIEKLPKKYKKGDGITFDKVLLIDDGKSTNVGTPYIKGEKVEAVFEEEGRSKKISVIKYKPKVRYRKKYGHRQPFIKVTIV